MRSIVHPLRHGIARPGVPVQISLPVVPTVMPEMPRVAELPRVALRTQVNAARQVDMPSQRPQKEGRQTEDQPKRKEKKIDARPAESQIIGLEFCAVAAASLQVVAGIDVPAAYVQIFPPTRGNPALVQNVCIPGGRSVAILPHCN